MFYFYDLRSEYVKQLLKFAPSCAPSSPVIVSCTLQWGINLHTPRLDGLIMD